METRTLAGAEYRVRGGRFKPCRILVIKLRLIGDVLLATPVFAGLRRAFPEARISACVSGGTETILENDPNVDEVFAGTFPAGSSNRWKKEVELFRRVRRGRYDLVLDLTTSDRSAILTRASGAARRIGYVSYKGFWGRSRFYTERVQALSGEHMVLKHCRMLEALEIKVNEPKLVFPLSDEHRRVVRDWLPSGEFFQVHPISRVPAKNWPAAFMAEVVNAIAKTREWVPVITGSADAREQKGISEIKSLLRCEHVDVSGKLTLKQLGAVSERAKFYLGVDTAPMHIAAAVGTPVVALFGPSNEKLWAPWCDRSLVLSRELDCRLPCKNKECQTVHCLREFTPGTVLPKIDEFLDIL